MNRKDPMENWPYNVLNSIDDPERGTPFDDIEEEFDSFGYKFGTENHPEGIEQIDFPVEWPFTIDVKDYERKDESIVRLLNTLPVAVLAIKRIDAHFDSMAHIGHRAIIAHANGYEEVDGSGMESIEYAIMRSLRCERVFDHLRDVQTTIKSLARDIDTDVAFKVSEWISNVKDRAVKVKVAFLKGFVYEKNDGSTEGIEVLSISSDRSKASDLADRYEGYTKEIYSIDFEKCVNDIYSSIEKVTLGFDHQ